MDAAAVYAPSVFRPHDDPQRCSRLVVALIIVVALALRVGWAWTRPTDEASLSNLPDQVEYLSLAKSMLAGNGLQMVDPRFGDTVRSFRMPGYPAFCALFQGQLFPIRVAQAVVDASTVLATIWLARRWLSPRLAYLAGLAVALDPIHLYFSSLILSETLFAALLTWSIACLAHGRSPMARGSGAATWWVGITLAVAAIYVRPSALWIPALLAGASVIHEHGSLYFKAGARVPVLTLVAMLTAVSLLPWAIRNRTLTGEWLFTTTNSGFTLYDAWNADADGSSNQSRLSQLPLLRGLSETQRSRYLATLAWDQVRHDPVGLIREIPRNLGRLWTPWPLSQEFGAKRLYVLGAAAHAIPLFVLAVIGVLRSSLPRGGKLLLLTPILIVTISHGLTLGSLRYRMPIHAELAVLAASALAWRAEVRRYNESSEPA